MKAIVCTLYNRFNFARKSENHLNIQIKENSENSAIFNRFFAFNIRSIDHNIEYSFYNANISNVHVIFNKVYNIECKVYVIVHY